MPIFIRYVLKYNGVFKFWLNVIDNVKYYFDNILQEISRNPAFIHVKKVKLLIWLILRDFFTYYRLAAKWTRHILSDINSFSKYGKTKCEWFFGHTRFKIPLSLKGQLSWNLRIASLHLFHSFDFPVCSILWNQVTQTDTFMNMEYYYVHIVTYVIHNMSYNSDVLYHFYVSFRIL